MPTRAQFRYYCKMYNAFHVRRCVCRLLLSLANKYHSGCFLMHFSFDLLKHLENFAFHYISSSDFNRNAKKKKKEMKIAKCVRNPKNNANANKNNETFVNRLWVRNDIAILNVVRDKPFSLLVIFVFCFPRYCIWCLSFSSFYCKLFYVFVATMLLLLCGWKVMRLL